MTIGAVNEPTYHKYPNAPMLIHVPIAKVVQDAAALQHIHLFSTTIFCSLDLSLILFGHANIYWYICNKMPFTDLCRKDTLLALITATVIYRMFDHSFPQSIVFACSFVVVFLLLKHYLIDT